MRVRALTARELAVAAGVIAIYFGAGKLGLSLAFVNASASAVWPPTGLAIAALLLLGPAILLGAFAVNISTSGEPASSVGIAVGNTLEAVVCATLVRRWAGGARAFDHAQGAPIFALSVLAAAAISATFGGLSLGIVGLAPWSQLGVVWLTWWLGDVSGALLLAPAILLWARQRRLSPDALGEAALLAVAAAATGLFLFGGMHELSLRNDPIAFLSFPVLAWAAFRFGPRGAATVALGLGAIAIVGTLRGHGPYAVARCEAVRH